MRAQDAGSVISMEGLSPGESDGIRYKREGTGALREALSGAFFTAVKPLRIRRVRTISVCMPDIDTTEDEIAVSSILGTLDIADKVLVYNDSVATFIGALAPEGDKAEGVIVIGDLGAVSFGMSEEGKVARAGGWEFFLSDEGSAHRIAKRALRSVMKSYDGRGEKTSLENTLVECFGLKDAGGLVNMFYSGKLDRKELVKIFRSVIDESKKDDAVSLKIIHEAEEELYLYAKAVIEKLQLEKKEFEIATRGAVFDAFSELNIYEEFEDEVKKTAGKAKFIEPRYEPIYGAVALALERETGKFIMPEVR